MIAKVRFPDEYMELFIPKKKERSDVFVKFYEYVLAQVSPSHNLLFDSRLEATESHLSFQVDSVAIHREDENKLKECYLKYFGRKYSKKYLLKAWGMDALTYGPALIFKHHDKELEIFPNWLNCDPEVGFIYVNTSKIWKAKHG